MGRRLGVDNLLSFDMGGTTAKASLIEGGAISRGREYEVGGSMSAGSRLIRGAGELLRIPTIDIAEVGAGGGSIAWIDPAGGLQVGPRSAGADPGPACYGRGGVEPTVTDANVLLGYMPAGPVADGQISISATLAEQAVRRVAEPLGLTLFEAASGIHRIANARMTRALRAVSSEKGRDPRDFALIAYGGAGPIHAAGLAEDLGMRTVLVPRDRGPLQRRRPPVRAPRVPRGADVPPRRATPSIPMRSQHSSPRWRRRSAARSRDVPRSSGRGRRTCATGARAGRSRSASRRGRSTAACSPRCGRASRTSTSGSTASGTGPARRSRSGRCASPRSVSLPQRARSTSTARTLPLGPARGRRIHIGGDEIDAPVRARASLGEEPEPGPLLVDEYDTTVLVPPGWSVRRDAATGTVVLERSDDGG